MRTTLEPAIEILLARRGQLWAAVTCTKALGAAYRSPEVDEPDEAEMTLRSLWRLETRISEVTYLIDHLTMFDTPLTQEVPNA